MKTIAWTVEASHANFKYSDTLEFDDDATDEEIEEVVRDEVANIVSWGWSEVKSGAPS